MTIREYVYSKAVTCCFIGIGLVTAGVIIIAGGGGWRLVLMWECLGLIILAGWLVCGYFQSAGRLQRLKDKVSQMDEKYLAGELLEKPSGAVERQYYYIMKEISRAAIGAVEEAREKQEDYQEYVENWIHEIKTPLTACSLILDNGGDARKLRRELKRADNLTESILYYARSRTIERDTQIREAKASDIINRAVMDQMELLIGAGISVDVEGDFTVLTDPKSVVFILKQLLINCAKYCPGCHVKIKAAKGVITLEDDGIGIPSHEVERVTDRGFSGTNGRRLGKSTGMGLYIVKELCGQLGTDLEIASEEGEFTRVTMKFQGFKEGEKTV